MYKEQDDGQWLNLNPADLENRKISIQEFLDECEFELSIFIQYFSAELAYALLAYEWAVIDDKEFHEEVEVELSLPEYQELLRKVQTTSIFATPELSIRGNSFVEAMVLRKLFTIYWFQRRLSRIRMC